MDATPGVESISVSWSGSTRAEAYFLYHNTSSPVGTANRIDLADVSSYQFKDLDPSKKYYFSVVGYNKTGPSSMSSEASATPVPLAPATISATTGAGSNSISWASSRGAAGGYTLYYSTSTPVTTKDKAFAVSGTSYTHTGLAGGTPIYYAVSAYNAGGNSALSSETSSTPVPAKPTGIAAVAGIEENTISWNAVAGATGYTLHYSESTPVNTSDSSFNVGGTSYKHTSLDAAKTYYYAVIADGSTGSSPLSAEASAQPIPGAPTLTVGTSTDTTVTVNWNTVSGAAGYRLYKSFSSPVTTSDTAVVGGGNSHTETGLTSGNTFYFAMLSQNTIGTSGLSNEVSATAVPTQPGTLVASPKPSGGGIKTQWTASAGHDGYRLLYRIGSHSLSDILASPTTISLSAGSTSKNITTVSINQLASIVLVAYNSGGESTYSNVVEEQPVPRTVQLQTADVSRPGKVTLTWLDNNGVNSFKVYREQASSGNPEVTGTLVATLSGSTMTYTDSGFPTYGGTTYRYAVVPEGGGGVGVIDRTNAIPTEPSWESVLIEDSTFYHAEVAGTPTGEAYVLASTYTDNKLYAYNAVAEKVYEVTLTTNSTDYVSRALGLTIAPDGNLMALMRLSVGSLPSGVTTTGTDQTFLLSKINSANGSVIWNKAINPFTDAVWGAIFPGGMGTFSAGTWIGYMAEMAMDSTGATYVAWGTTGYSGYVKYDTDGNLVTTYDRVADTTGETLGRYYGRPAVVVLPDDSFFWYQVTTKNSTDYLMGSKWDSSGNVIFKNRTLDVSNMSVSVSSTNHTDGHARHNGVAVADKVGNMYVAFNTSQGKVIKFNSEGTFISGTDEGIDSMHYLQLSTNGESVYAASANGYSMTTGEILKYNNDLTVNRDIVNLGYNLAQDLYVDPTNCFVYGAGVTQASPGRDYRLGIPSGSVNVNLLSNTMIRTNAASSIILYRTNDSLALNNATSSCPTPGSLPSATTPVSIAGNGSELGYIVYSGVNGFGDWRMKYSSASTPVEHDVAGVIDMSYGFDSQCVATATGVQCKGYQGGGLGDAANTTNTTSYVTVDTLTSAKDVSVGTDFACALTDNGTLYCWGSNVKGRLGTGNTNTYTTPVASNTSTTFVSIESGAKHSCALTSAGAMECWGSNEEGQMGEPLHCGSGCGVKSKKSPDTVGEFDLAGITKFSKVSIGAESLFTAALIDNGSIAVWGEYNSTIYTDHFVLNSGVATDIAAGRDHVCYIENGAVACAGSNSAGQTTVPTLTDPQSIFAGEDWSCAGLSDGTYTCWGSKAGW
jgi:hypothetical protein